MVGPETTVDEELRQRVVESMAKLLPRILRRDQPVTAGARLMEDLGMTSSNGLELLLELEEELEIQVDVEELDQDTVHTIGELADYIAGHSQPQ